MDENHAQEFMGTQVVEGSWSVRRGASQDFTRFVECLTGNDGDAVPPAQLTDSKQPGDLHKLLMTGTDYKGLRVVVVMVVECITVLWQVLVVTWLPLCSALQAVDTLRGIPQPPGVLSPADFHQ